MARCGFMAAQHQTGPLSKLAPFSPSKSAFNHLSQCPIFKNVYLLAPSLHSGDRAFVSRAHGYLTGAISHCAFGGVGIGLWLRQLFELAEPRSSVSLRGRGGGVCIGKSIAPLRRADLRRSRGSSTGMAPWLRKNAPWRDLNVGMAVGLLFSRKSRERSSVSTCSSARFFSFRARRLVCRDLWRAHCRNRLLQL